MANPTAINPNAIDAAAAIASNVHMAVSSGGQFIAASCLLLVLCHSRPDKEYVTSYRPEQEQRDGPAYSRAVRAVQ